MTSISTLVERLRRASRSSEPMRDVAVVVSEFVDDGGVELVDDPFHPAQKEPVTGLIATLARQPELAVFLIRSAEGMAAVPQRHDVPVALGVLAGTAVVDVFLEHEDTHTISPAGGVEVLSDEVYVIEPDVIHNIRFSGAEPGLALHVVLGEFAGIERTRWIDGERQRLAPSDHYPITALPMAETVDEPAPTAQPSGGSDSLPTEGVRTAGGQ